MAHNDSFDEPRFEALYRKLYPDLLRCAEIALRTGGSWYVSVAGRAEEVVQELFAFAWEHQADLWSSASPTGWLYRVLRYKVLELLKEDRFWRKHLIRAAGEMPASRFPEMPSDRNTAYPFLEQMRTEELEALLQQEFAAADGGEPDVDYIMAIMEVMKQRDANPPAAEADVDAAWRDFKENYQGQASAYETEVLPERDSSHLDQITSPSPKKKSRRILRAAVIMAACIVILCGAASAFGFDILQAFADWTAETFGFVTPGQEEAEAPQDDPYNPLRLAISEFTDVSSVPTWFPEGTNLVDDIRIAERSNGIRIQAAFETNAGEFTIRFQIYNTPPKYTGIYEINDGQVEKYESSGITYYIVTNNETCGITWSNGNVEVLIQGDLTVPDLEKMVDSIYWE